MIPNRGLIASNFYEDIYVTDEFANALLFRTEEQAENWSVNRQVFADIKALAIPKEKYPNLKILAVTAPSEEKLDNRNRV